MIPAWSMKKMLLKKTPEEADSPDKAEQSMSEPSGEEMAQEAPESTGDFTIVAPGNGARRPYDETMAPAEFSWEGAADRINFSRNPNMQPLMKSIPLNGATFYALENPYPGTWYWQVVNADGASEVRMFRVLSPERRNFPFRSQQRAVVSQLQVGSWPGKQEKR